GALLQLLRFFFSSRRRHTSFSRDWSSDVCSSDLLAEMVPTWAMALESVQGLASFFSSPTMAAVALSMPRLRSIGFMPAATAFRRSEERRVGNGGRSRGWRGLAQVTHTRARHIAQR